MEDKHLGQKIRELREDKDMYQKDLAKLLGVGKNTIGQYERHERFPDYVRIKELCGIFGVSADYLLGLTNKKFHPSKELYEHIINYEKCSSATKKKIHKIMEEEKHVN